MCHGQYITGLYVQYKFHGVFTAGQLVSMTVWPLRTATRTFTTVWVGHIKYLLPSHVEINNAEVLLKRTFFNDSVLPKTNRYHLKNLTQCKILVTERLQVTILFDTPSVIRSFVMFQMHGKWLHVVLHMASISIPPVCELSVHINIPTTFAKMKSFESSRFRKMGVLEISTREQVSFFFKFYITVSLLF